MKCDNILITDSNTTIVLSEQPFEVSIKLSDGISYRFETIKNDGVKGDTLEELAEFFEAIAQSMRKDL